MSLSQDIYLHSLLLCARGEADQEGIHPEVALADKLSDETASLPFQITLFTMQRQQLRFTFIRDSFKL